MAVIQLPCFTAACDGCKTESARRNVHCKTAEEATERALADAWTVLPDGRTYCMWCTGDMVRAGTLIEAGDGTGVYRDAVPASTPEPVPGSCACGSPTCTGRCPDCGMHETQTHGHNVHYGPADDEHAA